MAIEKQKLILISGIVLGVVAILMTKMYLDQQKQEAQAQAKKTLAKIQANQSVVLVAKQDIASGSVIEANMLESSIVPNQFIQPQAATSIERVLGMITLAPISKSEQISLSKLSKARREGGGSSLASNTPAGKRAISIAVDNMASLSGMVRPGDYVDVIATLQVPVQGADGQISSQVAVVPLFQNVLVLAVGQNTGFTAGAATSRYSEKEAPSSGGGGLITLALGSQEANLIAFVQEQGKMRLTLRSPADASVEPVVPASWETLFQYIMPQQKSAEVKEAPPAPVVDNTEYVEVFRGLNKEKVSLAK
ncbi:MAG: Flp pilus assembly protein CpaB [Candidatus Omnitrophica bacterium]|jgi:pilus assembly protein CpaB|nr:Flp pilus assembly protein CpaB [Candidatus Omnitrophota bacterium]